MFGLLIILVGVVFTLDNLDLVGGRRASSRYWPVGLIPIGAAKLWQVRAGHGSPIGGVLFVARRHAGCCSTRSISSTSASSDFWPLLLVFAGGVIVWQGIRGPPAARRQRPGDDDRQRDRDPERSQARQQLDRASAAAS